MNRLELLWRKLQTRNLHIVVASAHKVGSTWVSSILGDTLGLNSPVIPEPFRSNPVIKKTINLNAPGSLEFIEKYPGKALFKSHSFPPSQPGSPLNPIVVTVIRDPRDLMVSSVFYLSHLETEKGGWGSSFSDLNSEDRFFFWLEKNSLDFELLMAWNRYPTCWVFRYEDLISNPEEEMNRFFKHYNVPFSEEKLKTALNSNSFEAKTGRINGIEDPKSFFRKGIKGDWHDHFTPGIRSRFKTIRNGSLADMLIDLGYETGKDW